MDNIAIPIIGLISTWALVGALAGSYIGTIKSREEVGIPIKWVRRDLDPWYFCFYCKHTLKLKDMLPVISYLVNRGRCPYCRREYPKDTFRLELKGILTGPLMLAKLLDYGGKGKTMRKRMKSVAFFLAMGAVLAGYSLIISSQWATKDSMYDQAKAGTMPIESWVGLGLVLGTMLPIWIVSEVKSRKEKKEVK